MPYTYLIINLLTNERYYGVRYSKNCYPEELGIKYFSSSKIVQNLIKEKGIENFKFQIRKIFKNREDACSWESKVLRRLNVKAKLNWLNQSNNAGPFYANKIFSEEHRRKLSIASKGNQTFKGKKHSEETKMKISKANKGKKHSEETKRKMSLLKLGKKRNWIIPEDHKRKLLLANKNRIISDETRKKMSESAKGNKNHKGYFHSDETKKKMSLSHKKMIEENL